MASSSFFFSSFSSLALLASFGSQMWQLQFTHSVAVLRMTSRKGTTRQKINQMSIIFMSEVGGSSSILLVKMVVITSMRVRFTANVAGAPYRGGVISTPLIGLGGDIPPLCILFIFQRGWISPPL